jgi:hypothetical protein
MHGSGDTRRLVIHAEMPTKSRPEFKPLHGWWLIIDQLITMAFPSIDIIMLYFVLKQIFIILSNVLLSLSTCASITSGSKHGCPNKGNQPWPIFGIYLPKAHTSDTPARRQKKSSDAHGMVTPGGIDASPTLSKR